MWSVVVEWQADIETQVSYLKILRSFALVLKLGKNQVMSMFFDTWNKRFYVTHKMFHRSWLYAEKVSLTTYGYGGFTRTPNGIDAAVDEFNKYGRTNVPKLLIVITDGQANGGGSVENSSNAARFYIYDCVCCLQDVYTVCNALTLYFSSSYPWTRFLHVSAKWKSHC